jgi:hypothetical protein
MKKCPYCNKVITMCVPLTTLLASGTHNVFCQCCKNPITVFIKSMKNIDCIEKGNHIKESYYSAMMNERRTK